MGPLGELILKRLDVALEKAGRRLSKVVAKLVPSTGLRGATGICHLAEAACALQEVSSAMQPNRALGDLIGILIGISKGILIGIIMLIIYTPPGVIKFPLGPPGVNKLPLGPHGPLEKKKSTPGDLIGMLLV